MSRGERALVLRCLAMVAALRPGGEMSKEDRAKEEARIAAIKGAFSEGATLSNAGKYDEAIAKFEAVLVDVPKCTECYVNIGSVKTLKKDYEGAEAAFKQALTNAKPTLEVKSRRVGGATYQVPVEVRPDRRTALAMKWLVGYARDRGDKTMADRLASELLAASRNEGSTIKKKEDTHRMAEANKAFAHYRW